jgi:hypothetical protein
MKRLTNKALLLTLFAACAAQAGQPAQVIAPVVTEVAKAAPIIAPVVTEVAKAAPSRFGKAWEGAKYYGNKAKDGVVNGTIYCADKVVAGSKATWELAKANPKTAAAIAIAAAATVAASVVAYKKGWFGKLRERMFGKTQPATSVKQATSAPATRNAASEPVVVVKQEQVTKPSQLKVGKSMTYGNVTATMGSNGLIIYS